jgi:predicted HTH transcriptional regulator
MTFPAWADEEFSARLAEMRRAGEGQHAEFKEEFPQQGHSLCTEVAAFASSGGGTILLGVQNNGEVAGLNGSSEEKRDELLQRAQGLIASVQPPVAYQLALGFDVGCILGIIVELKQSEPVYYYSHRPYVRDGRTSRPATPDEVKSRVWDHPSAEHKRKMEELNYQMAKNFQEHMQRLDSDSAEHMAAANRAFLGLASQ